MLYFDNAATTKPLEEVCKKVNEFMEDFYNPSTVYKNGISVKKEIEKARESIANALHVGKPQSIFFTSGGTESNNLSIFGSAKNVNQGLFLCSECEHPSVYNCFLKLKEKGFNVDFIPCDSTGRVKYHEFMIKIHASKVAMVSVMHVNNEVGGINDISLLSQKLKELHPSSIFHVDCVQSFSKHPIDLENVDLVSLSGHKLGGLKGVGGLYVKNPNKLSPQILGGGQEKGLRCGTENVVGIMSFMAAVEFWQKNRDQIMSSYNSYKSTLCRALEKIDGIAINSRDLTSPHILNLSIDGVRGETILHMLEEKGIIVGMGSACSSKEPISRALRAMNILSSGTLRISFGVDTTMKDVEKLGQELTNATIKLREIMK